MSELHDLEQEFSRRLSQTPPGGDPDEAHRQQLRTQMLARFDEAAHDPSTTALAHPFASFYQQGKIIMQRPLPRALAVAAAVVVIAAVWLLAPGQQSSAEAFNAFATALVDAKTAEFQMQVQVAGQPEMKFKAYFLAPANFRQEIQGIVNVSDLEAGRMVSLNPKAKTALVMNMTGRPEKRGDIDLFHRVRELLEKHRETGEDGFKPVGTRQIDGREALGFRLESGLGTQTLWGDPKTGLPVLLEATYSGSPRTVVVMSDFQLDVELKPELFDTTPPADYQVQSFDFDASPFKEEDLVKALDRASEILPEHRFPESLDAMGTNRLILEYAKQLKLHTKGQDEQPPPQEMSKLMQLGATIGRGMSFALTLPESADAHYAGKGVERNAADRPIFWYKPEGQAEYHVIYANLEVRQSAEPPRVEGAVRLEKVDAQALPTDDKKDDKK